jgi:hypothetical protein
MDLGAMTEWKIWLEDIKSFDEECAFVHRTLAFLPVRHATDIISGAVQEFAKYVSSYHNKNCRPPVMRIIDKQVHDICESMLKAILLPCIYRLDVGITKSYFVQGLLLKLLYVIPNVETLIMPAEEGRNYFHLLVEKIPILTLLQEFHFHLGCTIEIIIELSKYCLHMKTISVRHSIGVNDECVEHLLKFRRLRNLNAADTSLSNDSYTALLLGLPQIQNINWLYPIDPVLRNLRNLPSVTEFVGTFSDAKLLVQKCRNVKKLSLHSFTEDISNIGELKYVTTLSFFGCICNLIGFSNFMKRLGKTLTTLEMNRADNLKMDDLINYCPVLNSLTISKCRIICTEIFHGELPHFKNLGELELCYNDVEFDLTCVLPHYVNLNVLRLVGMEEVTETFVTQIVIAGGFRNVTEFVIDGGGRLSMDTVWLVMQNCHNLTKLGNMNRWRGVPRDEVETLIYYIKISNLSLIVCL